MTTALAPAARADRLTDRLLYAAVAVPVIYFATLLIAGWFYPGYSHATQYASELGSAGARWPAIFNAGILLGGAACIAGSLGLHRGLRRTGTGKTLATLLALCTALWGVAFLFGALFPMPDERHGGFGVGLAIQFAPLFAALAFRRAPRGLRWVAAVLWLDFLAMSAMFVIMMGVGGLVTHDNVGLFQRGYGLTTMPWIALAAFALLSWRG